MKSLEEYKNLTENEINHLSEYFVIRSIYINASNSNTILSDNVVVNLKNIIMDYYYHDSEDNYSLTRVTDFISINYFNNKLTFEDIQEIPYEDMYNAIDEDSIECLEEYINKNSHIKQSLGRE